MTSNSYKSFAMREICISVFAIFNLHFLKLVFERETKFKGLIQQPLDVTS